MKINSETSETRYGISRIDDERFNTHAWRVSLSRRGKRLVKNFPDKKCGNKETALLAAMQYRDQLLLEHPPISRKEFCNAKRRNNKTGIPGVYKYRKTYRLKDGSIKENWYWEANWPDAVGVSISKAYPINKYGEQLAKQKAIRAREEGLKTVKGTFWAAIRGEVKLQPPVNRAAVEPFERIIDLAS